MVGAKTYDATCAQYELEISIQAPCKKVWQALLEDTNAWWLPDFHVVDPESTVEFDVQPGGRGLVEHRADGSFLQWFTVQACMPDQFKLYLIGHVAPDWGGPSISNLTLALTEQEGGCVLKVTDAHQGRVSEATLNSLESGWKQLFGEGLRVHVEA